MEQTSTLSIADYGLIGNCRTAALVSRHGSIDWCCFPRFDSGSFFGRLLDPKAGHFQISPVGDFLSEQRYLPDSNVLETYFTCATGEVRILDSFSVDTEENKRKNLSPTHEILRIVEGLKGDVTMRYDFSPRPDYGKSKAQMRDRGALGLNCENGSESLTLLHDVEGESFSIKAREKKFFSLTYNNIAPDVILPIGSAAELRLKKTKDYWETWLKQCTYQGSYSDIVRRSALTLKLLTFAPSGAIIAAPTTSLPEELKGVRNWDYRYCWLRDASLTIRALLGLGFQQEARAYLEWILHSTALTRPRLQVLYDVYGHSRIPEKILSWLAGYKNSRPVRIGNGADVQFQLDVYGEVMHGIYLFAPHMKNFSQDSITFLKEMADAVSLLWNKADDGIWEIRSGPLHHVHSKAMALVTLDCFIKLAQERGWKIVLQKYQQTAQELREQIEKYGYSEELNSYIRSYDDHSVDASLLTLPMLGANLNPERMRNTVLRIKEHLMKDNLIYRYLHHQDGLSGNEGTFAACSFWLVEDLAHMGLKAEARILLEKLLTLQNTTQLWPEELDARTKEYLGNYPQAFTHTAIIGAVLALKEEGL